MLSGRAVGCVNTKVRASYFIISYLSCRSCIALSGRGVWPGECGPASQTRPRQTVFYCQSGRPGRDTSPHGTASQPGQTGDLQVLPDSTDSTDSTDSPTLVLTGLFAVTASLPPQPHCQPGNCKLMLSHKRNLHHAVSLSGCHLQLPSDI